MAAGESARESARRQREKAERLQRSADLWERGAAGEAATALALAALPQDRWTTFHDLRWPGRSYANVDHVVVGPPGVFVIDSKNWSGALRFGDGVLRQNGFDRSREVAGAVQAAAAVAGLVPLLAPGLVTPVLCFVREEVVSGRVGDVLMCSTPNIATMLGTRPEALNDDQRLRLLSDLGSALAAPPPVASPVRRSRSAIRSRPNQVARTRGRRRPAKRSAVPALVALAFFATLIVRPEIVTGLADRVSEVMIGGIVPTDESPTRTPDPPKEKGKKSKKQQGSSQL